MRWPSRSRSKENIKKIIIKKSFKKEKNPPFG